MTPSPGPQSTAPDALLRPGLVPHPHDTAFRLMAETMPQLVWTATADGHRDYFNSRWFEYTGMPRDGARRWEDHLHPADREAATAAWERSLRTGTPFEAEYRIRRGADGAYRWFVGRALPLRDPDGLIVRWFGTCTDIDDAKHTENQLRVIAEAGEALVSTLDTAQALEAVAVAVVPRLADWCAIDLAGAHGVVRRMAVMHQNPAKVAFARDLTARYPDPPDAPHGLPHVLRTGRTEFATEIPDALLVSGARDAEHLALLRALGLTSYIIAPIRLPNGSVLGALTLVSAEAKRAFTARDVEAAEELARRVAIALERTRLYHDAIAANEMLADQAAELEAQTEQLHHQASELHAQSARLRQHAESLRLANDELVVSNAALRVAEERLSLALIAGGLGWWEWDIASGHVTWSPHVEHMYGLTTGQFEGTFDAFQRTIHPDDRAHILESIERTVTERRETFDVRFRYLRADGDVRWLEGHARLYLAADGTPWRLLGVVGDITDRARLEEREHAALRAAEAARGAAEEARMVAEVANFAKSTFLATMSHELRTPINSILGFGSLLADEMGGPLTEQQRDYLRRIRASADHLLVLIDEVLTLSRIEAGREQVRVETQDLRDLVRATAALIEPTAQAAGLALRVDLPADAVIVSTDPTKVRQILLNLLSNAVKFTERGEVAVWLERDREQVRIAVRDTGIGIEAEHAERIFDSFWQVRQEHTRTKGGSGLGLAVSRRLAMLLGGDLSVASTPDRGSTFVLSLPAGDAAR